MSSAASSTDPNAPYWNAAREGQLVAQCCQACGHLQLPARLRCKSCHSTSLAWRPIRPTGTVRAWCRFHRTYLPQFAAPAPYVVALIEMDDGLAHYGCILDGPVDPHALVGARLRAVCSRGGTRPPIHFQIEGDMP